MGAAIEIRHLRLLIAVHREGSLSAAARALGMTQPAVSQQIRSLEREVRTPLLTRNSAGAQLTDAGRALLRHGSEIIDKLSLAEAEVAALAGLRGGHVRLVAFPSAASTILPLAMTEMSTRFPAVRITLVEAEPPEAMEMLRRGECDLAVVFRYSTQTDFSGGDLVQIPLLSEQVHVALSANHPAADEARIELARLRNDRWVAGCPRCRGNLVEACAEAGFEPDIAFSTDDYVTLQCLAARGFGVALISDLMLAVVAVGGLILRPFRPDSQRIVSALSTRGLSQVPTVREMIGALARSADRVRADLAAIGASPASGKPLAPHPLANRPRHLATNRGARP